jgi:hypothetical protein
MVNSSGQGCRSGVHGSSDAHVGAATAKVASQGGVDLGVGGLGVLPQQSDGCHHLTALAVPTLRDVMRHPRRLNG